MLNDRPAEDKFNRLKKELQETVLLNYPNPDRRGCAGEAALKRLALKPIDDSLEGDAEWHHVTHCSECYREFLAFHSDLKGRTKVQSIGLRWRLTVAAAIVAAIVFVGIHEWSTRDSNRLQIAKTFTPKLVDLEGRAMTRSDEEAQQTKPLVLERQPLELIVRLPFGSKAGDYEVQLIKTAGHPLISVTGHAEIQNGTTALHAKMDLSNFGPGGYFLGVRRPPWDWTDYPVVLR